MELYRNKIRTLRKQNQQGFKLPKAKLSSSRGLGCSSLGVVLAFDAQTLRSVLAMDEPGVTVKSQHIGRGSRKTRSSQSSFLVLTIHETVSNNHFKPHYST